MSILIINIKELVQVREANVSKIPGKEMKNLPSIKHAFLYIEKDLIVDFGSMDNLPNYKADKTIDATGKLVLPTWCDSHTHIVYAGNREGEFADRINGLSYEEIANNGGGILNSAKKLQQTSPEDLYMQSAKRLDEVISQGTGAIEIKSGYGLTTNTEIKMLRVAKQLAKNYKVAIKTTFLGAHAFPTEFKDNKEAYIDKICNEMLPKIANENLADYIDVFCETGYFSVKQTEKIIKAGKEFGLPAKIHVNQFTSIGGVALAVNNNALTVDHLEVVTQNDISSLKGKDTVVVALPSCSYFLSIPYTPVKKIMEQDITVALASDYNPGSTPSGNMNFVVATACIKMKMTPEEAINAATINGAFAMGLEKTHGSITKGKKASVMITKKIPSYAFIPYSFGSNLIETVILNGELMN